MDSKRRQELLGSLRKPKQLFKVGLIDDLGRELERQIDRKIECHINDISIDFADDKVNDEEFSIFEEQDIIFFDATYEEDGLEAIDILERLIKKRPELKEKCKVLIGQDVISDGRFGSFEESIIIGRVKQLPHVIYGDGTGTKIEKMISCIQREGRKEGIEVPVKLPKGKCDLKILEGIKPFLDRISKNLEEQRQIRSDLQEFIGKVNVTNETERVITSNMEDIVELLRGNPHLIRNYLTMLEENWSYAGGESLTKVEEDKTVEDEQK